MLLMATLAALALVLAISGIYGVVSYAVSERTQELGIRIAIGAGKGDLQKMILSQCAKLVGIGLIAGFALSMALSSTLSGLLYDVAPRDPAAFAIAPVLIVLTALAASYFPLRRALRIDPLTAIRNQ
jgi:ABC-type antimicrobial peptide transport system permease subunit